MGAWGVLAHESDSGIDAMIALMDFGKERGGKIKLEDGMNRLRQEGWMMPQDASPAHVMETDTVRLWRHEYTVLALAEALQCQHRNGSYSAFDYDMFPTLAPDPEPQTKVAPTSDKRIAISFTNEDVAFLRDEITRFLTGDDDVTDIRFGWVDPEKWVQQTKHTLEQLDALKPSILAQLQEGKKAARESVEPPKDVPKRDSEREV